MRLKPLGPASRSNNTHQIQFHIGREAGDSGAVCSPEPAAKPCGSCNKVLVNKAAALDSIEATAETQTDRRDDRNETKADTRREN